MSASARARAVVLGVLLVDVAMATGLALWLVRPGGAAGWALVGAVLLVHAVAHALVLRAAVSPWIEGRTRDLLAGALVAVTAVAWPVLTAHAATGEEPWAWLAGFTVGALLVLRPWVGLAGAVLTVAGVLAGGPVRDGLVFAALSAVTVVGLTWLVVWMLDLLVGAEAGREAQARLAVAEERLRVARDLHDVLGHRLGVIALRAELAGDGETQDLAARTLREVREALHGYGTVDLEEQLRGAELVLRSAGIEVEIATSGKPSAAASQLFAVAVREAVTNILRHSAARHCRFELDGGRLTVENDGVGSVAATAAGTGIVGLAERARLVGGRVEAGADGDRFRLAVELAA